MEFSNIFTIQWDDFWKSPYSIYFRMTIYIYIHDIFICIYIYTCYALYKWYVQFQVVHLHVFLNLHFGPVFNVRWEKSSRTSLLLPNQSSANLHYHETVPEYYVAHASAFVSPFVWGLLSCTWFMISLFTLAYVSIIWWVQSRSNLWILGPLFRNIYPIIPNTILQVHIRFLPLQQPVLVLVPPHLRRSFFAWWLTPCRRRGNRPTKFWNLRLREWWHRISLLFPTTVTMTMIVQFQVGALPQPADLERQRERIMAEAWSALKRCGMICRVSNDNSYTCYTACSARLRVWDAVDFSSDGPQVQSVSNSLSDRQRDSNERLQKDLAEATVWCSEKPVQLSRNNRVRRTVHMCSSICRDDSLPQGC